MNSFILEVVSDVLEKHTNISELIFIVPSKRAGLFLKQELVHTLRDKTLFSPIILSIEEFIETLSGLRQIDGMQTLFEFYNSYLKTFPEEEKETFEVFSNWAQMLIQDFNEIDRYCIDHKSFFSYLSAIQDLNHWYLQKEKTELIKNYIIFWENLSNYYTEFTNGLIRKKLGYQGLLYRKAAENCIDYCNENKKHHILMGFNALNNAEQTIFNTIMDCNQGSIYWDTDCFFIENTYHEAASFLRDYKNNWSHYQDNHFQWVRDNFSKAKNINVIGVPKNVGQAKYAGEILKSIPNNQLESTALVLADETLLVPMLNGLPSTISSLNITMGLPIKETPIASFFEQYFLLHKNFNSRGFYYKSVVALLNTPVAYWLLGKAIYKVINSIKKQNLVYLDLEKLEELAELENKEALLSLFEEIRNANEGIEKCRSIVRFCKNNLDAEKDHLELEYIYHFHLIFNQLTTFQEAYQHLNTVASLYQVYKDIIRSETLDFRGEPFSGLQLMGMLESRCLDFETVIITSVNEGILPAGKGSNSFIPYDLKIAYNLPTYKEKDAIYTYHFYRLLQRAKNIYLLYNTENEGVGGGEKSRFLRQLEIDKRPLHQISNYVVSSRVPKLSKTLREIPKNESILNRLKELAEHGFSPSALTTYIRNPIDFYNSYILGVKESEQVEEVVAANTLGTIIHNTLENLYKPLQHTKLSVEVLKLIRSKATTEIKEQFKNEYSNLDITQGKNLLIFEVAKRYIHNFLREEETLLASGFEIEIISIERNLKAKLQLPQMKFPVFIKGKVDRIDRLNGQLRIIDYKTGKVTKNEVTISAWDMITEDYKYSKVVQVLAYAYMQQQAESNASEKYQAGIISFKNLREGFMPFGIKESPRAKPNSYITPSVFEAYEKQLEILIREIFDISIPFTEKEL